MAKKAAPKKKTAPIAPKAATKPKAHERTAKPSEKELLEKGRKLCVSYLAQRDGMEEELAQLVVDGMTGDEVNALIEEANTSTLTKAGGEQLPRPVEDADADPDDKPERQLEDFPALVEHEEFAGLVLEAAEAATTKNDAEKRYKAAKAKLIPIMKEAGADDAKVLAFGFRLEVYKGKSTQLNKEKLIEAGCPVDALMKGYKDTPYDDVRIVAVTE